ncbi:MAG: EamA family transporter [Ruminococcaceae bacterium]|nr:EamA family transporter [Oscillospiraceae bacterium]
MEQTDRRDIWTGAVCMLLASLCFSTGGLGIKLLPWSAMAINGARNLVGASVIGHFLLFTRHKLTFSTPVFIGALSMMGVTTFFTMANKMTTAANAIVLQFTAPVFVILLMALLFHVKPRRADIFACAAVLLGVCIFFVDGFRAGSQLGNFVAILSGVCYAGVFMMNASEKSDAISSCFLGQLAAGVLFSPFCLRETDFSARTLVTVFALGAVQIGLAYIFFSLGIRRTPPVTASLITGLEPVLNPIWVAIFYHETISGLAAVGAVVVVGSLIVYNAWIAKNPAPPARAE